MREELDLESTRAGSADAAPRLAMVQEAERSPRTIVRGLLRSARPKQWLKNVLVVAAPGAAGILSQPSVLARTAVAFASLCLVASATYLVNDVLDMESDRGHPVKRLRPVAFGDVRARAALVAAAVLAPAGLALGAALGARFLLIVGIYVAATMSYSLWLKRTAVLDIAVVASAYVLRALAGGAAAHVALSPWFLILTSSASLFAVAGKRASDLVALGAGEHPPAASTRPGYTLPYLRYVWMMASGVAIAAYCLWAFAEPHMHNGIAWSEISIVPFAIAILRYALVLEAGHGGAPEDVLLRDRPLQLIGLLWLVVYAAGVYLRG